MGVKGPGNVSLTVNAVNPAYADETDLQFAVAVSRRRTPPVRRRSSFPGLANYQADIKITKWDRGR